MTPAETARLFAYERWANGETLASLQRMTAPPEQGVKWLAHIAGASAEWHARIGGTKSRLAVWPALDLKGCSEELGREGGEWHSYLARVDQAEFARVVGYRNSKGEEHRSTVSDILTHLLLHAAYHRGQIAAAVRGAGGTPAYTDFIHPSRSGLLPVL